MKQRSGFRVVFLLVGPILDVQLSYQVGTIQSVTHAENHTSPKCATS